MKLPRVTSLLISLLCLIAFAIIPKALFAQGLGNISESVGLSNQSVKFIVSVAILSLIPAIFATCTSFPFIVTVMSILRQAVGLQQSPPNLMIVALSAFLTFYIMSPALEKSWRDGLSPYLSGQIGVEHAFELSMVPFKVFMEARVSRETLNRISGLQLSPESESESESEIHVVPLSTLIPAFMLDELSRAFQIGFLIFLPFLVIDIVVAAILMSVGMMMVPPAIVSLPFKLAFFVVANGWILIGEALVGSYR